MLPAAWVCNRQLNSRKLDSKMSQDPLDIPAISKKEDAQEKKDLPAENVNTDNSYPNGIYSSGLAKVVSVDIEPTLGEMLQFHAFEDLGYRIEVMVQKKAEERIVNIEASIKFRYLFNDELTLMIYVLLDDDKKDEQEFSLLKIDDEQHFQIELEKKLSQHDFEHCRIVGELKRLPQGCISDDWGAEPLLDDPNRAHNLVLIVEDRKFYVIKEYLATWSRYFDNMFYGNYKEKNQTEIKLEDIDAHEFEALLLYIHPGTYPPIEEYNVLQMLKLADRFEMPTVMSNCATFLKDIYDAPSISLMDRLELAEKHNLVSLQVACFERFGNMTENESRRFREENRSRIRKLSHNTLRNLLSA